MNVPVPPIFLYEKNLGSFEVMDGQQRLNAIASFYAGEFELTGLRIWEALNGKTYAKLPPLIKRGLDRAKISAITLMSDNSNSDTDSIDLRAQVFDRLNTGGEKLNAQELRNALYAGPFNELVIELSRNPEFTKAWNIPSHEENTFADGTVTYELETNSYYKRMSDVEIALRFFAFKDIDRISGSVRKMLDDTLKNNRNPTTEEINELKTAFLKSLELCRKVYGEIAFKMPQKKADAPWNLSKPLFDAQMIAMHHCIDNEDKIIQYSKEIKAAVTKLVSPDGVDYELMVGRANTSASIKERITKVIDVIKGIING